MKLAELRDLLNGATESELDALDKVLAHFASAKYDPDYIKGLIEKASKSWNDVDDIDAWLSDIRGH